MKKYIVIFFVCVLFSCNKKERIIQTNKGSLFAYKAQSSNPKKNFGVLNIDDADVALKLFTPSQGMETNQAAYDRDGNYFVTRNLGTIASANYLFRMNIRNSTVDSLRYTQFKINSTTFPVFLSTYSPVTNKLYLWQPGKWFTVKINETQKTFSKEDSFTSVQNAVSSTVNPDKPLMYFSNGDRIYSLDLFAKTQKVILYDTLKSFEGIRYNPNDGKIWGIKKDMKLGGDSVFSFHPETLEYKTPVKVGSPHNDFFSAALNPCTNEYLWINNKNGQYQLCRLNLTTLAGSVVNTEQIQGMIWVPN